MRNRTKHATSTVATWPRIEVEINDDGTGLVRTAGAVTGRLTGPRPEDARSQAIDQLAARAVELGRPVQASTRDPQGSWVIVVEPGGTVRSADPDPQRAPKRATRSRATSAKPPASLEREGADAPSREVPPTGHDRGPRPPLTSTPAPASPAPAASWWTGDGPDDLRLVDRAGLVQALQERDVAAGAPGPRFEMPPEARPAAVHEDISPKAISRRWWWPIIAASAVVVLAAAGLGAWRVTTAHAASSAYAQLVDARSELNERIEEAQDVLEASDQRVDDDAVREALRTAIEGARAAGRNADALTSDDHNVSTKTRRQAREQIADAAGVLATAVTAVRDRQSAWELDQASAGWQAARSALGAAIEDATAVLAAAEGQVLDAAVRTALSQALELAAAVRNQPAPETTTTDLIAATEGASGAAQALAAPTQAVRDAQAAWRAAQESTPDDTAPTAAPASEHTTTSTPEEKATNTPTRTNTGTRYSAIEPGAAWSDPRVPGAVSFQVTTIGVNGPVVVTVGSVSQTVGTGTGSFTATVTGVPSGTYPWSVSADDLVSTGSTLAVVP